MNNQNIFREVFTKYDTSSMITKKRYYKIYEPMIRELLSKKQHELWHLSIENDYAIAYVSDECGGEYLIECKTIQEMYKQLSAQN